MKKIGIFAFVLCSVAMNSIAQKPDSTKVKEQYKTVKESLQHPNKGEPTFLVVDQNAVFNGGDLSTFRNWVQTQLVYPKEAAKLGHQGKVFIQFSINSKGAIGDIKILRSSGDSLLDEEAKRAISISPIWVPARQSGQVVKQQFTIPISFLLTK